MIEQLDARVNVIIIEHLVGPIDFKQDILAVKVLAQLFSKIKPDVIHLHSSKAGTVGRISKFISKSKDTRVVLLRMDGLLQRGLNQLKISISSYRKINVTYYR